MKKLILIFAFLLLASPVWADTHTMTACNGSADQAKFATAYAAAANGDTIAIPAGNCTWAAPIEIAKTNITISGAGGSSTVITNTADYVFNTTSEQANGLRITGIKFVNGSGASGAILFNDSSNGIATKNFRIDNCIFQNVYYAIQTEGEATGVVDNCSFIGSYAAVIYGKATDVVDNATFPMTLGTSNAVFFELNTFTNVCSLQHVIASNTGSHYVFRYNTLSDPTGCWDAVDAHGYGYRATRGSYTWEVYENKFDIPGDSNRIMHMRGGQGVAYNNYFRGNSDYELVITDDQKCDLNPSCTYPCRDQINATYIWNNKNNCGASVTTDCASGHAMTAANDCTDVIQLNRDYWASAMPGYTAYTYPHPLRGAGDPDVTAPTLSSATINGLSTTVTLVFDEPVNQGAAYNNTHWDIDCTGAGQNIAMTYVSGNGTTTHVYSIATTVMQNDTCNIDFSGTANSMEDLSGNDLAAIVNGTVTNSSTQLPPPGVSFTLSGGTISGGVIQ